MQPHVKKESLLGTPSRLSINLSDTLYGCLPSPGSGLGRLGSPGFPSLGGCQDPGYKLSHQPSEGSCLPLRSWAVYHQGPLIAGKVANYFGRCCDSFSLDFNQLPFPIRLASYFLYGMPTSRFPRTEISPLG